MVGERRTPGLLFWKLFFGNAALMVLLLGVSVFVILVEVDRFHVRELTGFLESHARALAIVLRDDFGPAHRAELAALADDVGTSASDGVRVTFVAVDGVVLGDSDAVPATMESHADRPEIKRALATGHGESTRWSRTIGKEFRYVAVRVGPRESPKGVVRVSMAVQSIAARIGPTRRVLGTILLVGLSAAVTLALGLARLWSGRIAGLTTAARSLSRGDLETPIDGSGRDEIALLAHSLNRMRNNLVRQLRTIDGHRRAFESLLSQLHEGVVVAGSDGRVMFLNPAAARLLNQPRALGPSDTSAPGPALEVCVAEHELQNMLRVMTAPDGPVSASTVGASGKAALRSGSTIQETQMELQGADGPVSVLARASDISLPGLGGADQDALSVDDRIAGRLLVLTDITEIIRTIEIKTDFVANASHELRTPLAAVRAAVETVMNLNLSEESAAAERFLGVIDRHTIRLEALVADLLILSRVESSASRFAPTVLDLAQVMEQLRDRWASSAEEGGIDLACQVSPQARNAVADAHLLRLVLDNLVENAIKFTEPGGHVSVSCDTQAGQWTIVVKDDGCGIAAEEHQRVFERFYQVERARTGTGSRGTKLRGTGLGLAIVRHAAVAMGGTVSLSSQIGSGTTVTLVVPQIRQPPS